MRTCVYTADAHDSRSDRSDHIYHEIGVENHSSANSGQEPDFWNFRLQFVHACVWVSKKALGTSIRNTFELHLFENGLYRKRRYMRRNQPKFGG